MARRNIWLRAGRWRAFFRIAGVYPWLFAVGMLASAALFVESWHARRERAAMEVPISVAGLTPEAFAEGQTTALWLLGVWLPRLMWLGVVASAGVAVGVWMGLLFPNGEPAVDPAPRRRPSERSERPAKTVRDFNVGERPPPRVSDLDVLSDPDGSTPTPRKKRPKPPTEPTGFTPPKRASLPPIPLEEPSPQPRAKPKSSAEKPPRKPPPNADDEDRLDALY